MPRSGGCCKGYEGGQVEGRSRQGEVGDEVGAGVYWRGVMKECGWEVLLARPFLFLSSPCPPGPPTFGYSLDCGDWGI